MEVDSGWEERARLVRAHERGRRLPALQRAWGTALLALSLAGCLTQYTRYDAGSGRNGYRITCGNTFERCEAKANDLCPNGYERVQSSKRSKLDMPHLFVKTENEYTLEVQCERQ